MCLQSIFQFSNIKVCADCSTNRKFKKLTISQSVECIIDQHFIKEFNTQVSAEHYPILSSILFQGPTSEIIGKKIYKCYISTFQKTHFHINLIVQEHAHKKEKIDSTHSSDESNSHTNISVELIAKNKPTIIRGKPKLISLPPVHYELLFEIRNKKRRNSCCCEECGQQNQFQLKTQNLFVKHHIVHQKKFIIRKAKAIRTQTQIDVTQKSLKTLHINSPMMKYQSYSRTAQLILDQHKVKFKHTRICSEALIGVHSHFKTVSLHNLTGTKTIKAFQSRPSIF